MDEVCSDGDGSVAFLFRSGLPVAAKLERARAELLDLSARNRLLNMPRSAKAAKVLEIVDERSDEVFRMLVGQGRPFTFLAGKTGPEDEDGAGEGAPETVEAATPLEQPADEEFDARGVAARHTDTRLQTRLTSTGLQKRLLDLHHDARVLEEEQGVNILFLALGALRWIDPANAETVRHAPLILVPVRLERATAGERFRLRARAEELSANLSLEAWLDRVHSLTLPTFDVGEDLDPVAYMAQVASAVSPKAGWSVEPDVIVLGFFSFAKFLMYRDLDPAAWPAGAALAERRLVRGLMSDGFPAAVGMLPDDAPIDPHVPPARMLHVVDADGSQTLAVEDVRAGRDLVIQGPPGTGKSQTIANVIAAAVADGRTVLFVAEKMTALDVVKRRLDAAGVGDACLELHSAKASKRIVLEELKRTWALGAPRGAPSPTLVTRLQDRRDALNAHVERMHAPHPAAALTPFQVVGALARLQRQGVKPVDFALVHPESWTADDRADREGLVAELAARVEDIGRPLDHPWWGIGLQAMLPSGVERLVSRIADLSARLSSVMTERADIARGLETEAPATFDDFVANVALADRIAGAPVLSPEALGSADWDRLPAVRALVAEGGRLAAMDRSLADVAGPAARSTPVGETRDCLATLPDTFDLQRLAKMRDLAEAIPLLLAEASSLRSQLGSTLEAGTCAGIAALLATAERVAEAPDASPEAFAATVWDRGVDQAGDLAEAVAALESARASLSGSMVDAA